MPEHDGMIMKNDGFTLLELITVLLILGMLSAIAIPKYFDLRNEAINKAVEGALAEGVSRINTYFGQSVVNGIDPDSIAYTSDNLGSDAGDFTLSYNASGSSITVTAEGKTGSAVSGASSSKTVERPGA